MNIVDIFDASREGNLQRVKEVVQAVPESVNIYTQNGITALNIASYFGHKDIVEFLLQKGAIEVLDFKNNVGCTPLFSASGNGHLEIAKLLLFNGADVMARDRKKSTPLHFAAEGGHKDMVNLLLSESAEIDAKSANGNTPLYLAAQNGHYDTVNFLIREGAKVNLKTVRGATPLLMAAAKGHLQVVKLLISNGADLNALADDGNSPLSAALETDQQEVAKFLSELGAMLGVRKGIFEFTFYTFPQYIFKNSEKLRELNEEKVIFNIISNIWRKTNTKSGEKDQIEKKRQYNVSSKVINLGYMQYLLVTMPNPLAAPEPYFLAVQLSSPVSEIWILEKINIAPEKGLVCSYSPTSHEVIAQTESPNEAEFIKFIKAKMRGENLDYTVKCSVTGHMAIWAEANAKRQ